MKASITYLIVMGFISIHTYGQNFQSVKSDEIHYFATQTYDYILASRTESIEIQGTDSLFYTFQTVREDENTAASDPCHFYLGSAWSGQKTVIKADGRNIFYNKNNEPITIETQAVLNDTFLVYNYPSGDWIKGVVTNELQIFILDGMDNIKIIELFSNIPFQFSNDRIILSENHGFVETYAFYSFPEPYQGASSITANNDFPLDYDGNFELVGIDTTGFHKPTTADVFDFEIGDEYKLFSSFETVETDLTETFVETEIVNKFVWEGDSIVYFVDLKMQQTQYAPSGPSETTIIDKGLTAITYTNLESWNTPYLPEEFNGSDGWSILLINSCGDVEEITRSQAVSWDGQNTCLEVDENGTNLLFSAISGVGWVGKSGVTEDGSTYLSELVYYGKADGSSCGTNQVVSVKEIEATPASFEIYPNPTNGDLFLDIAAGVSADIITVVDKTGKVVRIWKFQDSGPNLNISDLSPGMYFVLVETETYLLKERIIKI
jgi:Secretion system C-terminal sorting domain